MNEKDLPNNNNLNKSFESDDDEDIKKGQFPGEYENIEKLKKEIKGDINVNYFFNKESSNKN